MCYGQSTNGEESNMKTYQDGQNGAYQAKQQELRIFFFFFVSPFLLLAV